MYSCCYQATSVLCGSLLRLRLLLQIFNVCQSSCHWSLYMQGLAACISNYYLMISEYKDWKD
jgi:hypothetical protein